MVRRAGLSIPCAPYSSSLSSCWTDSFSFLIRAADADLGALVEVFEVDALEVGLGLRLLLKGLKR